MGPNLFITDYIKFFCSGQIKKTKIFFEKIKIFRQK